MAKRLIATGIVAAGLVAGLVLPLGGGPSAEAAPNQACLAVLEASTNVPPQAQAKLVEVSAKLCPI